MLIIRKIVASPFFLIVLASCANSDLKKRESVHKTIIEVTHYDKPFSFEGKGAGAGMMLMSTMGPSGIAIGVAIDVGIGKDIYKAFLADGYTVESLVNQAVRNGLAARCADATRAGGAVCRARTLKVDLHSIGFKLIPRGNDEAISYFSFTLSDATTAYRIASHPSSDASERSPLSDLKRSGAASYQLLLNDMATSVQTLNL